MNRPTEASAGLDSGSMMRQKQPKGEQPSMVADSNSSFGMLAKKLRIRMVL